MSSNAWILSLENVQQVAIGQLEMIHLLPSPELFKIPDTPDYCHYMVFWQNELIPVMDVLTRAGIKSNFANKLWNRKDQDFYVAIIGYESESFSLPQYGGIFLAKKPVTMMVNNDQNSLLPEEPEGWQDISTSCFSYKNNIIPILNLADLFYRPEQ
jgi:chemotaxis signal transduction protein